MSTAACCSAYSNQTSVNGLLKSFLPEDDELPCERLDPYYASWHNLARELPRFNGSSAHDKQLLKHAIRGLPHLTTQALRTEPEKRFAYVILTHLASSYIFADSNQPDDTLPIQLADPLYHVSQELAIQPIITHAAVDLWSWKLKNPKAGRIYSNLDKTISFTGTNDERAFCVSMTAIEAIGAEFLGEVILIPSYIRNGAEDALKKFLVCLERSLKSVCVIMRLMMKDCKPEVFWNQLRIYLGGYYHKDKLPNGVLFEGINKRFKCDGGSAAQSTMIQVIDAVLGIEHDTNVLHYLRMVRAYMPKGHRVFLEEQEAALRGGTQGPSVLRSYVLQQKNESLTNLYNNCIKRLIQFREVHGEMVKDYILQFACNGNGNSNGTGNGNGNAEAAKDVEGTGGTRLQLFLTLSLEQTKAARIVLKDEKENESNGISQSSISSNESHAAETADEKSNVYPELSKDIKYEEKEEMEEEKSVVTPWQVKGKVNYMKLIEQFGTELIDEALIARIERITKKAAHPWIRRGIFFSHRSLEAFLDAYERGESVFLYTGRGPTSDSMHIGHLIPFHFTLYLQQAFKCPLVIQISDEEKYFFKCSDYRDLRRKIYPLGFENAKDIIACGFDPELTYIFSNRDHRFTTPEYEELVDNINFHVSFHKLQSIFGLENSANIGMIQWPVYQTAAAFSQAFPHIFGSKLGSLSGSTSSAYCLVAYAIDQDPYFRLSREIAPKLGLLKPCSIMCSFIPPLIGTDQQGKMSSSTSTDSTIFLTDDPNTITKKVITYAFSGGGGNGTLADHKKYGGNINTDIPCIFLRYFEMDETKLKDTLSSFERGELTCADTKRLLAEKLVSIISEHQKRRSEVDDAVVRKFYEKKAMHLPPRKVPELTNHENELYAILKKQNIQVNELCYFKSSAEEHNLKVFANGSFLNQFAFLLREKKENSGKPSLFFYLSASNKTLPDTKVLAANIFQVKGKLQPLDDQLLWNVLTKMALTQSSSYGEKPNDGTSSSSDSQLQVNKSVPPLSIFSLILSSCAEKLTGVQCKVVIDTSSIVKNQGVYLHPLRSDAFVSFHYNDLIKFLQKYAIVDQV